MSWLGNLLGAWLGSWIGGSAPAESGEMAMQTSGAGTLTGTLSGPSLAAHLSGSGYMAATLTAARTHLAGGGGILWIASPVPKDMAMRAAGHGAMRATATATAAGSARFASAGSFSARPTLAAGMSGRGRGSARMASRVRPSLRLAVVSHGRGRGTFNVIGRRNAAGDDAEIIACIIAMDNDRRKAA
jgi:hypothetical protein